MRVDLIGPRTTEVGVPEATLGFMDENAPGPEDVGLDQVTSHGWRVFDARLPRGDPFRVLAFVERQGHSYDVMQLGNGFECHAFTTFGDALAHVIATSTVMAQQRLRGATDWLRLSSPVAAGPWSAVPLAESDDVALRIHGEPNDPPTRSNDEERPV